MNEGKIKRIVCFASGAGSIFSYVVHATVFLKLPIQVSALISDQKDAGAIQIAKQYGVPIHIFPEWHTSQRATTCEAISRMLDSLQPNLLVLLGFMKILDDTFVKKWGPQTLNTHPSLLPSFPGAHGVKDAQTAHTQVTGTTVHVLSKTVDSGEILFQRPVLHLDTDTQSSLHERIKTAEKAQVLHAIVQYLDLG